MKIDLHLIQNFAPSNLNRDDTGAPKDCEFGACRRARVSSQCLKRSIRQAFVIHELFGSDTEAQLGARTKRLVERSAEALASRGRDADRAAELTAFALQGVKLKVDDDRKTQYLLFLPRRAIGKLSELVDTHWDVLAAACPEGARAEESSPDVGGTKKKATKKSAKQDAKASVPKAITTALGEILSDVARTPDLALFGRMIADEPEWNTDAACQVAHAISTHRVSMEFDFFTAVDDLRQRDVAGSDMMGTVAFQSACFYRYACLDVRALAKNLGPAEGETGDLLRRTLRAFLAASAFAIPTGKQNSMAAQNLPSYLLATIRPSGAPQSFANAFAKPVRADASRDLIGASIDALEAYVARTTQLWGVSGAKFLACSELEALAPTDVIARCSSFDAWLASVVDEALPAGARS